MECTCLFLPPRHRPSPVHYRGRLPAFPRQNDFMTDPFSRLQPFRYVQALRFARLPDRSYRCRLSPQGSRGFYVRAEHASLPRHASDMLTTRPGNWWCGDLHPTRFTALSAAPVITGFINNQARIGDASRDFRRCRRGSSQVWPLEGRNQDLQIPDDIPRSTSTSADSEPWTLLWQPTGRGLPKRQEVSGSYFFGDKQLSASTGMDTPQMCFSGSKHCRPTCVSRDFSPEDVTQMTRNFARLL